jgi:hypothetical protein
MKAISLWEPWATLIALGEKRYETRSWNMTYRGPLLICASKSRPPIAEIIGLLYRARITVNELSPGRAVALVDLVDITPTRMGVENLINRIDFFGDPFGEHERFYGDFSPGRFAWKLENIRRFVNPPLIRGRQGLFNVPDDLIKSLDTYDPI